MALKDNVKHIRDLLANIQADLEKADKGNKAASQRVRTGTVKLEKIAKQYRKESVANEKKTKGSKPKKAAVKSKAKAPVKAHAKASSKAPAKAAAKAPAKSAAKAPAKSAVKAKPKAKAHKAKAHAFALRRPTAKLPARRFGAR